ncbi:MAG: tetratricopeptide repeat protein [Flavobacterium sp.]|nr:tetratricopeptide repeat protein [Flavobacterium sp.]
MCQTKKINEKLPNCYIVLGNIYYDLGKIDTAIENYIRSINQYDKKNPQTNLALAYYNLGKCYLEKIKLIFQKSILKIWRNLYRS